MPWFSMEKNWISIFKIPLFSGVVAVPTVLVSPEGDFTGRSSCVKVLLRHSTSTDPLRGPDGPPCHRAGDFASADVQN